MSDSYGGPAAVAIHDVPIVAAAADLISDVTAWCPCCIWPLHYFCRQPLLLASLLYVGHSVVAFIPDVACISAVVGSNAIAVILAVPGVPLVTYVLTVAGLTAIVASLLFLAFLLLMAFLLLLASLMILTSLFYLVLLSSVLYSVDYI
jgi:hypothetical protein